MNKKILLIEDQKEIRENTADILTLSEYDVLTAKNGKEGIELAKNNKFDLIICDIMMPVLDGYGVLHFLKKNEDTASVPFIFFTAKADRIDFRKGMEMGADDYLTKPFEDIELINAVESRLKRTEIIKKEFTKNLEGLNEFLSRAKGFEDLKKLSENKEVRIYKKKDSIYNEDAYPRGIYFICKGKVKTFCSNADGKGFITGLYKEGDFFGYLALLEESQYSDSATALENSEICLISKEDFYSLIYKNAEVSRKFIKLISDNLQEKEQQLIKLAYNSVRKRVAEALVTIYKRYRKNNETSFSMNISREDLASLAGTAQESVSRTLSDFKEEGLVDIKDGTIAILNYDKLVMMRN